MTLESCTGDLVERSSIYSFLCISIETGSDITTAPSINLHFFFKLIIYHLHTSLDYQVHVHVL